MKLFYKPGACSLASHIALCETGATFEIEKVDTDLGRTETGNDYGAINPNGYVPALQLEDGEVLTEGAAVLQYIASCFPEAGLASQTTTLERARLQETLNWVAAELHKAFSPLFNTQSSDAAKEAARVAVAAKFDRLETQLSDGREWIVGSRFSVADAYLFTVANWANFTGINLSGWPSLAEYITRITVRPSVLKAMKSEGLVQ
ncbi:glutathione transferase GstA [Falsihalocynthiibacter sp. BN13B15]|uniref:glutathione transferase GstA n=1 Tax=Falsihalocynthiibacter sp. BN13B15 TaxID=3240871 RepID=UPI00350E90C3